MDTVSPMSNCKVTIKWKRIMIWNNLILGFAATAYAYGIPCIANMTVTEIARFGLDVPSTSDASILAESRRGPAR